MQLKIDSFIIGAQKAGTSSLLKYLGQHPSILAQLGNEFTYFVQNEVYNIETADDAIKEFFNVAPNESRHLLAKNVGVMYSDNALKLLHQHNPQVKLILVLRNPVQRAYSAFWYAKRKMWEVPDISFEEAIEKGSERFAHDPVLFRHCDYLGRGTYSIYVQNILKYFPPENVYVCLYEEFSKDPTKACSDIFSFLKLSPFHVDTSVKHNVRSANRVKFIEAFLKKPPKPLRRMLRVFFSKGQIRNVTEKVRELNSKGVKSDKMSNEMQDKLTKYFAPYNDHLRQLLPVDIEQWSK